MGNPKNLNEVNRWLLLNTDTSLWTKCADKYAVRDYVTSCGCASTLVKFYEKWDRAEDIDFENLPSKFVLKSNNGTGAVMIIKDKNRIDQKSIKKELKRWISRPFGYSGFQTHYLPIARCIIAEELLEEDERMKVISPNSLVDYKIWCINGKAECIVVFWDVDKSGKYCRQAYDLEWNVMPNVMRELNDGYFKPSSVNVPRPVCLDSLISIAEKLAKPFPQVRVDMYVGNVVKY